MKSTLDDKPIAIPCPKCSHKLRELIGNLRANPLLTCHQCNTWFKIDETGLNQKVAQAEQTLTNVRRAMNNINKQGRV